MNASHGVWADWSDGGGAKTQTPAHERTCAVGRRDDGVAAVARACGDDVVGRRLPDRDACTPDPRSGRAARYAV